MSKGWMVVGIVLLGCVVGGMYVMGASGEVMGVHVGSFMLYDSAEEWVSHPDGRPDLVGGMSYISIPYVVWVWVPV